MARRHCADDKKMFKCDKCDQSFMLKHLLTSHIKQQHLEKQFECDICCKK